jgi:uncharacterized membrane protein YfhO
LVVIADTYYPGWRAWVDGAPSPIYPANLSFRAVAVAAGVHVIDLRYQPTAFSYGAALSSLTVLACILLLRRSLKAVGEGVH